MDNETTLLEQSEKRIKIIKGQLDGLLNMMKDDAYCTNLLDQSYAIQNSLKSLDILILERHLRRHVVQQFKEEKERAIKELVEVFKRKQKSE